MDFKRSQVNALNKYPSKNIASIIVNELMRHPFPFKYLQWYEETLDLNGIKVIYYTTSGIFVS